MKISRQNKIVFFVVFFLLSAEMALAQEPCKNLIWSDEFTNPGAPAADKWDYDTGGGGWGNNELQTYTNNRTNSYVENGKLYIKAVKVNGNWTSSRLVSRQKGDWLYGRIEVKAKLPSGKGTWPAIWMLPTDWVYGNWPSSGEIDIMEHVGYDPGVVHGTAHTEAYYHSIGTQKGASITVSDAISNFHVYSIEWDAEKIRWFMDDQLYFTFNNEHKTYKEWPFDKRFHLLLNIAIGGNWGGAQGIDPNLTEAVMEVEYVRVYQSALPKPVVTGPTTAANAQDVTFRVQPVEDANYRWILPEGVTVVSGTGTNQITVKWNNMPGDIQLEMSNACETVSSAIFHVGVLSKPESPLSILPKNENQEIWWKAVPGPNNTLILGANNNELNVNFQVTSPTQNPHIRYDFENVTDLSELAEMVFELKTDPANKPSNMRIDLVDTNGNVNLSQLFKIESFAADDQFHAYSFVFSEGTNGSFLMGKIAQIRIYINYGVLGKAGSGTFSLKNLKMQTPNATGTGTIRSKPFFKVYPNPASDFIHVYSEEEIQSLQLYHISGQLIRSEKTGKVKELDFPVEGITPGLYLLKLNGRYAGKIQIR